MHADQTLLAIFVVFLAGMVGGELAQRLRMPSVVGQIAAGTVVGPSVLGWVTLNDSLEMLSEFGAVFLLFSVGLETRLNELKNVGRTALSVGTLGVIVPFLFGGAWAYFAGYHDTRAAFIGAAFVATSAGITARVLQEKGLLSRIESKVILAAAIIDDILAMLLLGVVTALQGSGGFDPLKLGITLAEALGFVAVVVFLGRYVMRRAGPYLDAPMDAESPLTIAIAICIGLAAAASFTGLAAIIGAFLAGTILAETPHREDLEHNLKPIMALMVPFFFVVTGTKVDLAVLSSGHVLAAVGVVTVLAILSKLIGCGLGALQLGRQQALAVGIGMVPRGEVGILVASLGQQAGVFKADIYAVIVAMSLLTSMVAPPLLGRAMAPKAA